MIIGIGNPLLCDDTVGIRAVRRAQEALRRFADVADFKAAHNAGFDLLGDLTGYRRAVIIDSILSGRHAPGTVTVFDIGDLKTDNGADFPSLHALGLQSIVEIGLKCGYSMPDEIEIIAVEAADVTTFSETPTPAVEAATTEVVEKIRTYLERWYPARD